MSSPIAAPTVHPFHSPQGAASPNVLQPISTTPQRRKKRLSSFHIPAKSPSIRRFETPSRPAANRASFRLSFKADGSSTPFRSNQPIQHRGATTLRTPETISPNDNAISGTATKDRRRSFRHRPQQQLSKAEIEQMYSDTIKLCQDNKINARNTWTLSLIDYMPMLFKTGPQQGVERAVSFQEEFQSQGLGASADDMNFHRAGVTLDAGVKIYCSRVDSVHTNAFKVLGGLSRTGRDGDDADDIGGDENDDDPANRRKRKGKRTGRCTLENNMANITSHKLETDLAVDPLFQKMSAAFDEGGAKGMLLNNLPVGPKGQVIFDSGELADSLVLRDDEDSETRADDDSETAVYDVTELLPNQAPSEFEMICGSFLSFFRAKKAILDRNAPAISESSRTGNIETQDDPDIYDNEPGVDFDYSNEDLLNAESIGVFTGSETAPDRAFHGIEDDDDVFLGGDDAPGRPSSIGALAARRASLDLVETGVVALSDESDYAFFDPSAMSGWAGPQHWRFRAAAAEAPSYHETGSCKKKAKRPRGKTAMLLDFSEEAPKINFKKEFAQGKKENSYHLSNTVQEALSEKKVTLPEDMHFTVRSLTSLFLKPRTFVRPRDAKSEGVKIEPAEIGDAQNNWYDFDNDCDNENFCPGNADDFVKEEVIEQDTHGEMEIDLVPEPTRVEKIDISYAKVAKRVDVRELKTGMWSRLCGESTVPEPSAKKPSESAEDDESETEANGDIPDVRAGKIQTLREVVQELPSFVPESSLTDVSLPYVFICLLHLANEKTLKIDQSENGSLTDLIITSGVHKGE